MCYIETKSLDGETNLKQRKCANDALVAKVSVVRDEASPFARETTRRSSS